jgi:hypothetical protein
VSTEPQGWDWPKIGVWAAIIIGCLTPWAAVIYVALKHLMANGLGF